MASEQLRYCIATVGLPARGKTFIARKIARWLVWLGYQAKIFNVGNYRRQVGACRQERLR